MNNYLLLLIINFILPTISLHLHFLFPFSSSLFPIIPEKVFEFQQIKGYFFAHLSSPIVYCCHATINRLFSSRENCTWFNKSCVYFLPSICLLDTYITGVREGKNVEGAAVFVSSELMLHVVIRSFICWKKQVSKFIL